MEGNPEEPSGRQQSSCSLGLYQCRQKNLQLFLIAEKSMGTVNQPSLPPEKTNPNEPDNKQNPPKKQKQSPKETKPTPTDTRNLFLSLLSWSQQLGLFYTVERQLCLDSPEISLWNAVPHAIQMGKRTAMTQSCTSRGSWLLHSSSPTTLGGWRHYSRAHFSWATWHTIWKSKPKPLQCSPVYVFL